MNIFDVMTQLVRQAILSRHDMLQADDVAAVVVEPPRDPSHGDLASNAAMVVSKKLGIKPRDIAEALGADLLQHEHVETAEIAGPGFLNLRLAPSVWWSASLGIVQHPTNWGRGQPDRPQNINVEYVSANPTGPMHVGHCRGAVVGDALASLLEEAGHHVVREYYINDAGAQVDVLARSAFIRYREALGHDVGPIPEGLYPGDYLIPLGQSLAAEFQDQFAHAAETEWLQIFRMRAVAAMMSMIRDDLLSLNISHDIYASELALVEHGKVDESIAALDGAGLMYEGILEPPKGKPVDDWEPRPQYLFRSSQFGDDVDRPVRKSDGSWTYFASDIAYHRQKAESADLLVDVWGADHGGYVKRMSAATTAITDGKASLKVILCQLVKLFRDGEPVKMSKRSGNFVTLREVVDEVGADAVRFMMLMRKADAPLDFDFAKVLEQSKDNPVFYVQYAHARICSVLRKGREELGKSLQDDDLLKVDVRPVDDASMALVRKVAEYPRMIEQAARNCEPHRVAYYAHELAALFHAYWNRGKDEGERFVDPEAPDASMGRLVLARMTGLALARALHVLGVVPVEEL